ncbi:hypothetical protein SCUCBS95973_007128 [Sporothrix curviconia]|uniref:Zn(2)-C6 fungal-type domain-containing protein n=1 Tax=Sporothrix curviconia TaxID=1260050 RepID=A0ABP0CAU9_9PEZI
MDVDKPRPAPPPLSHHHRRDVTLRISQVVSACTFCKSRKIKCDGVAPACGCCTKFGRAATCSLADGAARPAHDYVAYLQSRIAQTRSSLSSAVSPPRAAGMNSGTNADIDIPATLSGGSGSTIKPASASAPFDFNADASTDLPGGARHGRAVPSTRKQRPYGTGAAGGGGGPASAIDTLIADIGALPISTSSHAHRAALSLSSSAGSGPTLSTVLLAAASKLPLLSIVQPDEQQHGGDSATRATHPDVAACLPDESAARKLATHYLQQVYPRLPFFSMQGFWAQFQQVYGGGGTAAAPLHAGYSYFTVLLVLAIATSSLSRSADSMISNQARRLFQAGLQFRESAIRPNTIVGVQSLLFLIQFATLNPSVLDAWYLIGVGMRNCVDLGLHQDPDEGRGIAPGIAPELLETRRRLWWSMYSFDRSLSIGCGRPTEIADALIHVQLPSFRIESSATAVEIQGYLQRYRALQLQSEIYDALNHPPPGGPHASNDNGGDESATSAVVDDLRRKLDAWQRGNLPERNRETLADSEWLMSKMLLFRPCRLLPQRSLPALGELWVSARGFTALYRQLVETNGIFYVLVACEKVYWTGLVLLYSYWRLRIAGVATVATTATDPQHPPEPLLPLDLWRATKDISFILQTLSERWEDGKILSAKFDTASARVIELLDGQGLLDGPWAAGAAGAAGAAERRAREQLLESQLPHEVVTLSRYASLVSIWAAAGAEHLHGGLGAGHNEELQDLVARMI